MLLPWGGLSWAAPFFHRGVNPGLMLRVIRRIFWNRNSGCPVAHDLSQDRLRFFWWDFFCAGCKRRGTTIGRPGSLNRTRVPFSPRSGFPPGGRLNRGLDMALAQRNGAANAIQTADGAEVNRKFRAERRHPSNATVSFPRNLDRVESPPTRHPLSAPAEPSQCSSAARQQSAVSIRRPRVT